MIHSSRSPSSPLPSEITPRMLYLNRRDFLRAVGFSVAGALLAACRADPQATHAPARTPSAQAATDELGDPLTGQDLITSYTNFYEFTTSKQGVDELAEGFRTRPWTIEVRGLVHKPGTFNVEDLLQAFPAEERVYRMRCVEGWSMVIPWMGFELARLLDRVEPMTSAAYVGFTTLLDPDQMPGVRSRAFPWPYTEGLRLDEARHRLTLLSTGLYGESLLPQNGAPLRLVVPWKYGFKSIKSIVRLDLLETPPPTFWNTIAPQEYGFYANVNPEVDHPRWSQATEMRLGDGDRRDTLLFNGYAEEVGSLYTDLDLRANY